MSGSEVLIRLWAPLADSAFAVVDGQRLPMRPQDPGYWTIDLPAGTDYLLAIDDQEPRPDPRSAQQPFGVHGPSRAFDTSAYRWNDAQWPGIDVVGSVFYELHVGTFTPAGTLDSAIDKLDHLVRLGVQTVELMPVVPFPGDRGWGYDGVDLYAVHEAYGGPAALQRFVDAAHGRGLAVCLDVVYNHFGPAGNYAPVFAPYFTDKHDTPWGSAINLDDEHSDGVRDFICENAIRWLREFHIDALRLDAVHALVDEALQHILAELSERVDAIRPSLPRPVALIAESDLNQPSMVEPRSAGGMGMDAQWADDVHHALHAYLTDETFGYYVDFGPASVLRQALEDVFVHNGSYFHLPRAELGCAGAQESGPAPIRGLHPEPRSGGQPGSRGPARRQAPRGCGGRRGSAAVALTVHSAALPGPGVGHETAFPVLHRPRTRTGGGCHRGSAGRVPEPRLGGDLRTRSGDSRSAGAVHLREQQAGLVGTG